MYTLLLILWRARARRLRERRLQRQHLERQWRQIESLLAVRRRNLSSAPVGWEANPLSGLSLTAAAGLSAAIHTAMAVANPINLIPAAVVGTAGVIWSLSALASRNSPATDERLLRMHAQLQSFRLQLSQIELEIHDLESE